MVGADNNLSASSKVDLSKLPQCLSSLEPHMQRVNYRLAQWKRSHENIVECPPPEEHGWVLSENNILEPLWCNAPNLPAHLVDLLANQNIDLNMNENEEDDGEVEMMENGDIQSDDNDDTDSECDE